MISNGLKCKLMSVSMTETDLSESVITSSRALHLKIQKCNIHKYRHVLSNCIHGNTNSRNLVF
jgi:hypothetical protein